MEKLSREEHIDLLKMEYEKLTKEQHVYIQQYTPTLSVFGTTVLAGFAVAIADTKYQAIYPLLPFVVFAIAYIGIAQAHIISALGLRIRVIEGHFRELNAGVPVLEWEHLYAPRFVFASWIKFPVKQPAGTACFPSPILGAVVYMAFGASLLMTGCCVKAHQFIGTHYGVTIAWCYVSLVGILTVGMLVQGFAFFSMGNLAARLDTDALSNARRANCMTRRIRPNGDKWTLSDERAFIENLFSQRINFYLVLYSIVVAGFFASQGRVDRAGILIIGIVLCSLLALAMYRVCHKLILVLKLLHRTQGHPVQLSGRLARQSPWMLSFPVNTLIGVWFPIVSILLLCGLLVWTFYQR